MTAPSWLTDSRGPQQLAERDPVLVAVREWLTRNLSDDAPVVVACSGGADSLALAAAVAQLGGRPVVAAVVDHGLQEGSRQQAARTAEVLRDLGFAEVTIQRVAVGREGGPEAAARSARYAALRDIAAGSAVLLGHTADDQAETVLLGLARGSGPRSIAGMRPWNPPWGRPLLGVRRADTESACRAIGLDPWTDSHNSDPSYTRVRLRTEVLPLLDSVLGGGVAPALARTAELMADDLSALEELSAGLGSRAQRADGALDRSVLAAAPTALRRRVLRSWAADQGAAGLSADHLRRVDQVLLDGRTGAAVRLPGGVDAVFRHGGLWAVAVPAADAASDRSAADQSASGRSTPNRFTPDRFTPDR